MPALRWHAFALPLAVACFVVVAALHLRNLPAEVPVHFDAAGQPDRWLAPKNFIALQIGLVGGLALMLLLARWVIGLPGYDADGRYREHPHLRWRLQLLIDLLGAGGILLITWTAYLCARAARMDVPALPRLALLLPLSLLLAAVVAGYFWLRPRTRSRNERSTRRP